MMLGLEQDGTTNTEDAVVSERGRAMLEPSLTDRFNRKTYSWWICWRNRISLSISYFKKRGYD